jgi:hypothetical protein
MNNSLYLTIKFYLHRLNPSLLKPKTRGKIYTPLFIIESTLILLSQILNRGRDSVETDPVQEFVNKQQDFFFTFESDVWD